MTEQETIQTDHEETTLIDGNSGEAEAGDDAPKLVPVAEARRYRKRAQAAEKILEDLKAELAEKTQRLDQQDAIVADLQQSRLVDERLMEAEAIDLEAARLLTEIMLSEMQTLDVEDAVSELRRRKPYLFRQGTRTGGVSSPAIDPGNTPQVNSLQTAAADAVATGRRSDVLHYLRLRRRGG